MTVSEEKEGQVPHDPFLSQEYFLPKLPPYQDRKKGAGERPKVPKNTPMFQEYFFVLIP